MNRLKIRRFGPHLRIGTIVVLLAFLALHAAAQAAPLPQPTYAQPVAVSDSTDSGDSALSPLASTKLKSRRDTFASSDRPNDNFGGDSRIYVGQKPGLGATRSLVWFDLSNLAREQAVTKAILRLNVREAGPSGDAKRDTVVQEVLEDWDEGDVTWNRFPESGARFTGLDIGTGLGWVIWNSDKITDYARSWRWPDWQNEDNRENEDSPFFRDNHGFFIQGYEAEGSYRGFDTHESGSAPELELTHIRDEKPPKADMKAIPQFINTPRPGRTDQAILELRWIGADPEPATGIDFMQLYAEQNQESVKLIEDRLRKWKTTVGTDAFPLLNGRNYGFGIYAIDLAGNVEPGAPHEQRTLVDLSPPQAMMTALPPYSRGPITLNWGGQDLPNGPGLFNSGIATYDVWFNIGGTSWAEVVRNTTATSMVFNPVISPTGTRYQFKAEAIDRAGNRQVGAPFQTETFVDAFTPIVRIDPVLTIDQPQFAVRWLGTDLGGSGIARYDLQYNVNNGPWVDWQSGTTATTMNFTGTRGNVYGFRARALDNAGNQGAYPAAAQMYAAVLDPAALTVHLKLPWISAP